MVRTANPPFQSLAKPDHCCSCFNKRTEMSCPRARGRLWNGVLEVSRVGEVVLEGGHLSPAFQQFRVELQGRQDEPVFQQCTGHLLPVARALTEAPRAHAWLNGERRLRIMEREGSHLRLMGCCSVLSRIDQDLGPGASTISHMTITRVVWSLVPFRDVGMGCGLTILPARQGVRVRVWQHCQRQKGGGGLP